MSNLEDKILESVGHLIEAFLSKALKEQKLVLLFSGIFCIFTIIFICLISNLITSCCIHRKLKQREHEEKIKATLVKESIYSKLTLSSDQCNHYGQRIPLTPQINTIPKNGPHVNMNNIKLEVLPKRSISSLLTNFENNLR